MLFVALSTAMLAGCGLTSSPAQGLTFTAPRGWKASPGILGLMQFWKPAANGGEMLVLIKSPRPLQIGEIFSDEHLNLRENRIDVRRMIRICGNRPAQYVEATGTETTGERSGRDSSIRLVGTNVNGSAYFAAYIYPEGAVPNAQAVAALRELCPIAAH